ncbi:MAG: PAS domain S-box protein [Verrucomicrobia bacterium]|nr:PAS domain S-box protein [Verrucomicrobiota bacterium]
MPPNIRKWTTKWSGGLIAFVFTSVLAFGKAELPQTSNPQLPRLTTAKQVLDLPAAEARRGYPVRLRATVTYVNEGWNTLFIQDATAGVFVSPPYEAALRVGHRVEVEGITAPGEFAPSVIQPRLRILGEDPLPPPRRVSFDEIAFGREDSQWVEIEGLVRSADLEYDQLSLEIALGGGRLRAWVKESGGVDPASLVEAQVRMRGVCGTVFNPKRQLLGPQLFVSRLSDITVAVPQPSDPYAAPVRTIESLLQYSQRETGQRVKVAGVVTHFLAGESIFIRDATGSLRAQTRQLAPADPGDEVEIVGFPKAGEQTPILENALYRRVGKISPPTPKPVTISQVYRGSYHGELVRIEGKLVEHLERPLLLAQSSSSWGFTNQLLLVMEEDNWFFNAELPRGKEADLPAALRDGSRLEVTGICSVELYEDRMPKLFHILVRSPQDIRVLKSAPWWTVRRAQVSLALFMGLALFALASTLSLRSRMRKQTHLIRERLEREAALESRYRDLVENATDIVYTHDLEGNITSFNPAGEKLTGYTSAEAVQLNISRLVAPDQLALAREMTRRKIQGEPVTIYELDLITKQGRRITVEISSRPILQDHRAAGVQGFARDISERKRSEARAAEFSHLGRNLSLATTAEEAARIVLETADRLLGWDACTLHLLAPDLRSAIPVLNYDVVNGQRTAVLGTRTAPDLPPIYRKVIEEGGQLILREQSTEPTPGLVPFGDPGRLSACLMFVPIRHRMKVVGILSIQSYQPQAYNHESLNVLQSLGDLCAGAMARIQAGTALRESEERFSKAFRMSPVPINISTFKEGTYLDVNDGLLRLLGYSREEVIGRTSLELGIWVNPADRAEILRRILAEQSVRDKEIKVRRKSGEVRTILASFELIHLGSEPCLIGISYDITDRLRLESQLQQAQKMEAVGQLAAGVAHDFNNIMTIIQGHASLVLATHYLEPEVTESLQEVSHAADRAAKLTRQLLTFSRRQVMQPRLLSLNEVVGQATRMMASLLGEGVSVECELDPDLPAISADSGMLEQLIMNLAINARDAMPRGGQLWVRTRSVLISSDEVRNRPEARPGQFVLLTVSDTGHGMDGTTLRRIFEPFFTTKEFGQGTGLGLATAYGIVKQHQGWIEVQSEVGRGTTFHVFFPRAQQGSASEEIRPDAQSVF